MGSKVAVTVACIFVVIGITLGTAAVIQSENAMKTAEDKGEISYTFYIGLGDVNETQAKVIQNLITDEIKEDNRFGYTTYLASGSTHLDTGYVDDKFTVIVKIAMVTDEKGVMELAETIQEATSKIVLVEKTYGNYQLLGI